MKKTAIEFYKEIQKEEKKYKLVNGLFIVKYDKNPNDEKFNLICYYIGEFNKKESALNPSKTNKVNINPRYELKYYPKNKCYTTGLGVWKPLNINFIEKPIKNILK